MIVVNSRFLTKEVTGIVRYASELTPHLKDICGEIIFVTPGGIVQKELSLKLGAVEFGKFSGYMWEQFELPWFLKQLGEPLLLNLSNTGPFFYKNQVTVIHDIAFIKNPDWYSRRAAILFKIIISRAAKISKQIITLSEFTKSEIIRYLKIPGEKIKVIHAAVPDKIINLSKNNYNDYTGDYILTVSSLQPRKNISLLINCFNKLGQKDLKLIIAGSGNRKIFSNPRLKGSSNPDIIFTGYVSDEELTGLYKNAKLFVYPSLYEGFGFPPLEALSCGCPALISNTSSLPEICGTAADYFDPYDEKSLTDALQKNLLQVTKTRHKLNCSAIPSYSWELTAQSLNNILKEGEYIDLYHYAS
jgi:glycosyltransferase involved in cell wall biosynthesis